MGVIAEWHWLCDLCDEHSEEPCSSEDSANEALHAHMEEVHDDRDEA